MRYFAMGDAADSGWKTASDWPPASRPLTLYLGSDDGANSLYCDGVLLAEPAGDGSDVDRYTYDPMVPVPTRGGNFCCLGGEPEGSFDQRPVEARQDVLVYSSERRSSRTSRSPDSWTSCSTSAPMHATPTSRSS